MKPNVNCVEGVPRRFRDPIYDLYTFYSEDPIDGVALALIDTPAFQRLRRIKQLGFADHVYPGASHTRFAHSLGVYAAARLILAELVSKGMSEPTPDFFHAENREDAVLAALLHDVGHGPFSHAFEKVHESLGLRKPHESWTRDIILHEPPNAEEPTIKSILGEERANRIADLLDGNSRDSCWSAMVSSAFDADRLDYVRRDRTMSGTATGAIDFTWLLEHVSIAALNAADPPIPTFAVNRRALQQAETFLLSRYQLYNQVYFHKICRGLEKLMVACLTELAEFADRGETEAIGLPANNLLVRHLSSSTGRTVQTYLRVDDAIVNAALQQIAASAPGEATGFGLRVDRIRNLATRIINRKIPECLDLEHWAAVHNKRYAPVVKCALAYAKRVLGLREGECYFFDEPTLSVYGKTRPEMHKKLWIKMDGREEPVEITEVSGVVRGQAAVRKIGRLFFLRETERDATKQHLEAEASRLPDLRRRGQSSNAL